MSDEHNIETMTEPQLNERKWALSRVVHVAFVVVGVLVSLVAFLGTQSFVDTISGASYKRIAKETSEVLAKDVSELEFSLRTLSTLIALSDESSEVEMKRKLRSVGESLAQFQYVLWVKKQNDEQWKIIPLYVDPAARQFFDYKLFSKLPEVQQAIISSERNNNKITMLPTLTQTSNGEVLKTASGAQLFALVKSVQSRNSDGGVIVGVTNLDHVLGNGILNVDPLVSHVRIRDLSSNSDMFSMNQNRGKASSEYDEAQVYDLQFAGRVWEITSRFYKQKNLFVLELFPYFVLAFGVLISLMGGAYLRGKHFQALRFAEMNKALATKNSALEEEVRKRETLNEAASRAERENRAVIDSVSDIIFETDISGKLLFLNAQWSKITGFEVEQSMGLELFKMLHPQDQEQVEKAFHALIQKNKQEYRTFSRLRSSDGTFRAVELAVSMIREDNQNQKRVVGTLTDVEERRRAERALSEAEKKYRNIVENAAGGIFQLTPEGLYLSANPALARILKYKSPEQLLREVKNANESVYINMRGREAFMNDLKKRGSVSNHETQVKCRDGELIWVNENIRSVTDDGGNILYFEGSLEDISSRKESAMAMQEAKMHSDLANRAKSEFLANMSHELRTPLNSIIGFSEMIKNEVFGPIETREYWDYAKDIHESGSNLLTVINEILDISKIEAGERQLTEGVIDIEGLVGSSLQLLSGKVESGGVTVTNNLRAVPRIIGEELAIKQVIMNLLSNAVKFTPDGGRVTISSEVDREGRLHLSFTDTGIGLDEHEIKKALSPFGQVNSEFNRSGSGTGLGLTLVDALVKLHGGEFDLFSQKGIGTTATVIFPKDSLLESKSSHITPQGQGEDITSV